MLRRHGKTHGFPIRQSRGKKSCGVKMLDDPLANLLYRNEASCSGVNHLGVQAETEEELEGIPANLQEADNTIGSEGSKTIATGVGVALSGNEGGEGRNVACAVPAGWAVRYPALSGGQDSGPSPNMR